MSRYYVHGVQVEEIPNRLPYSDGTITSYVVTLEQANYIFPKNEGRGTFKMYVDDLLGRALGNQIGKYVEFCITCEKDNNG